MRTKTYYKKKRQNQKKTEEKTHQTIRKEGKSKKEHVKKMTKYENIRAQG